MNEHVFGVILGLLIGVGFIFSAILVAKSDVLDRCLEWAMDNPKLLFWIGVTMILLGILMVINHDRLVSIK